jgi:rhodanese-related sulfurtransferase
MVTPRTEGAPSHGPRRSIDEVVDAARTRLKRLDAHQAHEAAAAGAVLVDIRYAALRDRDGTIPGALIVERNELEWRLDPLCDYRLPEATDHDRHVVVICNEGYASSLAAVSLQDLGLHRATDLDGGFQAWRAAGLPVDPPGGSGNDSPEQTAGQSRR